VKFEILKNQTNTSNIQIKIIFSFFEVQDLGVSANIINIQGKQNHFLCQHARPAFHSPPS